MNDAMVLALADIIACYHGLVDHVQCLAHIINLVVQVILHQFDKPKNKNKHTNQKQQSEKACEQHQEPEYDSDTEKEGNEEEEGEMDEMDIRDGDNDMVDGIEEVEAAMKQDMVLADEHVKPMRQVLSKVSSPYA